MSASTMTAAELEAAAKAVAKEALDMLLGGFPELNDTGLHNLDLVAHGVNRLITALEVLVPPNHDGSEMLLRLNQAVMCARRAIAADPRYASKPETPVAQEDHVLGN